MKVLELCASPDKRGLELYAVRVMSRLARANIACLAVVTPGGVGRPRPFRIRNLEVAQKLKAEIVVVLMLGLCRARPALGAAPVVECLCEVRSGTKRYGIRVSQASMPTRVVEYKRNDRVIVLPTQPLEQQPLVAQALAVPG